MSGPAGAPEGGRLRAAGTGLVLLVLPAAAIVAFYASLYPTDPQTAFAGFDTAWYVWRGKLAALGGLEALVGSVDPPFRAQAFRAGYPLLAGFLDTLAGVTPRDLVFEFPALAGAIIGLAAGAFAVEAAREPRWSFPVYAVATGASINVILTGVDHLEHLLVIGVLMAAATTAVLVAALRPAITATVLLLASGTLIHWSFTAFFAGFLAVLGALLLPRSLRWARQGTPLAATPSARLAATLLGAAAVGGGALAAAPEPPVLPGSRPVLFLERLGRDLPRVAPVALLAAGGIPALLRPPDRRRRLALTLAGIWAASPLGAAILAPFVRAPVHRLLAFAFGLPLLATAAVVWLARRSLRIRPRAAGAVLGALVLGAALVGGVRLAREGWRDPPPRRVVQLGQAEAAGRYLERVGGDRPVVFVIDPVAERPNERIRLHFDLIRAALPAGQIRRTHAYAGEVERLLEGLPTVRPGEAAYNQVSLAHWEGMRAVLDRDPIIVALGFANPGAPPEGTALAPGVTLVRGPDPPGPAPADLPLPTRPSVSRTAGAVTASLALLTVVGLGWSAGLVPAGWLARTALAPAFGVSMLVLGGLAAGRLGLGSPEDRPWVVAVLALLGWSAAVLGSLRARRLRRPSPGRVRPPEATEPG